MAVVMTANYGMELGAAAQAARSVLAVWRCGDAGRIRKEISTANRFLQLSPQGGARETEARELVAAVISELHGALGSKQSTEPFSAALEAACYSLLRNVSEFREDRTLSLTAH